MWVVYAVAFKSKAQTLQTELLVYTSNTCKTGKNHVQNLLNLSVLLCVSIFPTPF